MVFQPVRRDYDGQQGWQIQVVRRTETRTTNNGETWSNDRGFEWEKTAWEQEDGSGYDWQESATLIENGKRRRYYDTGESDDFPEMLDRSPDDDVHTSEQGDDPSLLGFGTVGANSLIRPAPTPTGALKAIALAAAAGLISQSEEFQEVLREIDRSPYVDLLLPEPLVPSDVDRQPAILSKSNRRSIVLIDRASIYYLKLTTLVYRNQPKY